MPAALLIALTLIHSRSSAPLHAAAGPSRADCSDKQGPHACTMTYYGGHVIPNAKVYAVKWGAASAPPPDGFFSTVTNSDYMDWLAEYGTGTQRVGRGDYAGLLTITPAAQPSVSCPSSQNECLTDTQIQGELTAQIDAGNLPPPDANTLYVLFFPPGLHTTDGSGESCVDYCGYHGTSTRGGANVYYAVIPDHTADGCEKGCGEVTTTVSHELCEAVSDAEVGLATGDALAAPLGWYNQYGGEVGDACSTSDTIVATDGTLYTVQQIFSNKAETAAGGGLAGDAAACVTTRYEANDFRVYVPSGLVGLNAGESTAVTVTLETSNGAPQDVTLSAATSAQGVTATLDTAKLASDGTATLTLTAGANAPSASDVQAVVTASGASVVHTAAVLFTVAGTPPSEFTIALTPSTAALDDSGTATYAVTTAGTAQNIALAATNLPAGVTAAFSPAQVNGGDTATLTLTASATAPKATATFTVTATAGTTTHTAQAEVVVAGGATPDAFSMKVTPASLTLAPGTSGTFTVSSGVVSGNPGPIALSTARLPAGLTATFDPPSIAVGETSTLTLAADAGAQRTKLTQFNVVGQGATSTAQAPAAVAIATGDFSVAATPGSVQLVPGASAAISIALKVVSGSPGTVQLSADGVPADVDLAFDNAQPSVGETATLTLTALAGASDSVQTVTLRADDGAGTVHTAPLELTVVAHDFSVAVPAGTVRLWPGGSAGVDIVTASTLGGPQALSLAVSGFPAGVTATFAPKQVTAGEQAVLTLTADASAKPSSGTFTVTATSPSYTRTASGSFSIVVTPAPPSASLDAPAAGATLSGVAPVVARATVASGATLTKLEVLVDGTVLGSGGSSPLQVYWSTTEAANGPHTLTARATDSNGLQATSAALTVNVSNAAAPPPGSPAPRSGCAAAGADALALLGLAFGFRRRYQAGSGKAAPGRAKR